MVRRQQVVELPDPAAGLASVRNAAAAKAWAAGAKPKEVPQIIFMPYVGGVRAGEVLAGLVVLPRSTVMIRRRTRSRPLIDMSTDPIEAPSIGAVMGRWP